MAISLTISLSSSFAKKINKKTVSKTINSWALVLALSFYFFSPLKADDVKSCSIFLKKALAAEDFSTKAVPSTCPHTKSLIEWLKLREGTPSFSQISDFLKQHPTWPLKESLRKKAELSLLKTPASPGVTIAWFVKNPPLSPAGTETYCDALMATNKKEQAFELLKKDWHSQDLTSEQQKRWLAKYKGAFSPADHFARVTYLLNNEKEPGPLLLLLTPLHKQISDTRLALLKQKPDAEAKWKSLSAAGQKDEGFLYEKAKWLRRQDRQDELVPFFLTNSSFKNVPAPLIWRERNLLTRHLIEEKRYADAYKVVKPHGLTRGEDFATGEWLAGWLALRFLKNFPAAQTHFETLHKGVSSPISLARATYWLGRTHEDLKNPQQAKKWFEKAHLHPATYYGQLAYLKTHKHPLPVSFTKTPLCSKTQQDLFKDPLYKIINLLGHAKAPHTLLEPFFIQAAERVKKAPEQDILLFLAYQYTNSYGCVAAAKLSAKIQAPLREHAYPKLTFPYLKKLAKIDPAFVHAIIRQESRFKATALSSAGAMGLMQLMPETAKLTAKKFNLLTGHLHNEEINLIIGSHHLYDLFQKYNQNIALTAAAYNAGSAAVDRWIQKFGDPRHSGVDSHDWVELIPYAETRNYVQRIYENYEAYKKL